MKKMYAVRDVKAGYFLPPFLMLTDGEALRAFEEASINPQTPIGQHPEDFQLFFLGDYDEITGIISTEPVSLIAGLQALQNVVNSRKMRERIVGINDERTEEDVRSQACAD